MKPIHLRAARLRAGLTQEQLERKSGVSQASISRLETREHCDPTLDDVVRLAKALDVEPLALRFGPRRRNDQVSA